jgi:hypothetical protein
MLRDLPDSSPSEAIDRWRSEVTDAANEIIASLGDGGDDHRMQALETLMRLQSELAEVATKVRRVEGAPNWKPRHKSKATFKAHEKRRAA